MPRRPGRAPGAGDPPTVARHARRAVGALFFLNGFAYASVVPRLPLVRDGLGLSNTALGAAIAAMPLGALAAGLAAGPLVTRAGSARVAVASAVALGALLPALAGAPSWAALAVVFALLGTADAAMDVAMNTHGLRVQRRYPRSIITGFHARWSVGAVVGGLAGTAAAGAGLGLGLHLGSVGALVALAGLATRRALLPGGDDLDRVVPAPAPGAAPPEAPTARPARRRRAASPLLLLGGLVVAAGLIEDTPSSWGAALLRDELGVSAGAGGAAFVAFQGAMTVGRLLGDRVIDHFGPRRVVRAGAVAGAFAVTAGLAVDHPLAVVVGLGVAGLGAAAVFPVVYQAAGNLPGVATGNGVGLMAWTGRLGFLVAPPLAGAISDHASLRAAFLVMPLAALAVVAAAGVLPEAPPQPARRGSSGRSSSTR